MTNERRGNEIINRKDDKQNAELQLDEGWIYHWLTYPYSGKQLNQDPLGEMVSFRATNIGAGLFVVETWSDLVLTVLNVP